MSFTKKILKFLFRLTPILSLRRKLLRLAGYQIGKDVYFPSDLLISDIRCRKENIFIGNRVAFGPRVILITDSGPNYSALIKDFPTISGKIIIEDDVWIGAGVIILPNVIIGKYSIVAAGAVCTKNVEPYSIVGGVPARLIRKINEN